MNETKNTGIIQSAKNTAVQAKESPKTIQDYVKVMSGEIAKALPSVITPERFTRMVLSALSTNPKLGECTPKSFLGAMMTAAQIGLEPNTALGQAFLIPYYNHGILECQFQIGYKGLIDLAYRSGEVSIVQANTVYENDLFEYELGLEPKLRHIPAKKNRGEPIYYYAMFRTKIGGYGFQVMSFDDVMAHGRRYSKSFDKSPWKTNFDEMAKKTVLKSTLKYAPLKSDFVKALDQDGTIKTEISEDMYSIPSDLPLEADYVEVDDSTGEVQEVIPNA